MGIIFTEKQVRGWDLLTDAGKTRILFDGGSRSGKTILAMEYLVMRALRFPGSRQLIARKHRTHAKQSIWNNSLKKYLSDFIPSEFYALSESELSVKFRNSSSIVIGGLDEAERVEKILGNEYLTVFLNEATQLSWNTVLMIITRLSQTSHAENGAKGVPKLILDCNPRNPRHWLYIAGVRKLDPDSMKSLSDSDRWARLSWSAYDNKINLPEEYLHALETLPESMRERMLNGIWKNNDGAVFNEFDETVHVVKPFNIPSEWKRVRSIDFGYTNPFVCLWGALDHDGRLYIYKEHYKSHMRTTEHARIIQEESKGEKYSHTAADHDAGERAELEANGIYTEKALKDVREGIQMVKNRLVCRGDGKPGIFFFCNLVNTISELYEYIWAPASSGSSAKEEPLKENDHAMDALRYMIMSVDRKKRATQVASAGKTDNRWR